MIRGGSDPGSLEGLLERGRGAGWAAAFAHPERAREIVIDCVLRDPRWDRQIESRAEYYAQLLLGLDAPLEAVVDAARAAPEDAISLARQVTEELARRGAPVPPELAHAELGEEMRADDSGIRPQPTIGPPPIATSASTRALLVSATPAKVRKLTNVLVQRTSSGDRDAVRMAARDGSVAARNAALRTLGRWKDATALAIVDDALDAIARGAVFRGLTSACTEYLVELGGDEALSRARVWCALGYPWRVVADRVLAAHAEPADLALLDREMARGIATEDLYRVPPLATAIGRTGSPAGVPTLGLAWRESRYSFARDRVLEAIVALAGPDHPFALEALWDCEAGVRADAFRLARGPVADARRRELAADPWEDSEVRRAAEVDSGRS